MSLTDEKIVDVPGLAAHLSVDRNVIYRLCLRNAIPFYRVGKKLIRFRVSEVERALAVEMLTTGHRHEAAAVAAQSNGRRRPRIGSLVSG